jgi:hypothetical protein
MLLLGTTAIIMVVVAGIAGVHTAIREKLIILETPTLLVVVFLLEVIAAGGVFPLGKIATTTFPHEAIITELQRF